MQEEWTRIVRGLVRKPILDVNRYVPGRPISDVIRELGLTSVIKLASNENPLGPSPKAIDAIQNALIQLYLYPDDNAYDLRNAIAKHHNVSEDQIVLGNGGAELIKMMAMTFLNPGDEVLLGTPSFGIYREDIKQMGVPFHEVLLDRDFNYDLEAFCAAMNTKTKLVIICSPNNPTGTIVTRDKFEKFLSIVPKTVLIVIDEAYFDFVDSIDYPNGLSYICQYPNLFVLRTFSKNYGLAGIRVGYGIANSEIVFYMNKVRVLFNVNSLAQVAAIAALQDKEHLEASKMLVLKEKEFLYREFSLIELKYIPTYANFIAVEVPRKFNGDDKALCSALLRHGIIVRPGSDQKMPGYLRITIGTRQMNEKLLEVLTLVCKEKVL